MADRTLPPEPEELEKIDRIRNYLVKGKADPDQIAEVDEWERKVKEALIILNVEKHEGIKLLVARAIEQVSLIDQELTHPSKPIAEHIAEVPDLFRKREMWEWLIDFFGVAKEDLANIRSEIDRQLKDDEAEEEEDDDGE